jgi:type I restriction enzyme M protein
MQTEFRNNNKEIFAPLKDKWLIATPEEVVRQNYICHLVNQYGYSLAQMEQEDEIQNENKIQPDILIWCSEQARIDKKQPTIAIVCHAVGYLKNQDYLDVENYALLSGVKFFVTYSESGAKTEQRVFKFSEEKPPLQLIESENLPDANTLNNETELVTLLNKTKSPSKEEFKKIFFACHDAIRNNDRLSPEMAFDEISKVLFIKIRYEKENNRIFDKTAFQELAKTYQELFIETKEKYKDDGIFENTDKLRIKDVTFIQILDKLSMHNLANVSEDIKGVAFEEFLGKTFRGDLGQFFTPRTLVEFMVQILDPQEGERIADPCCGSGGFLINTFDYIKKNIKNNIRADKRQLQKEYQGDKFEALDKTEQSRINTALIAEFKKLEEALDNNKPNSRLHNLSHNCIFGTDAEPRSARTAKMNMIMQGDGHSGVHHHDGLLNINGMFENRFDVILTNPPFGARVSEDLVLREKDYITGSPEDIEKYTAKYGKPYTDARKAAKKRFDQKFAEEQAKRERSKKDNSIVEGVPLLSFYEIEKRTLTEVIFMERCLNLLRKGGRMGVVLPEGFLNGTDLQAAREFVESKAKLLLIVSVPQSVFVSAGASVKSSLVFLKKFTEEEEAEYKAITKAVKEEINEKYGVAEKQQMHLGIWHKIQAKRAYIKDVKSIKTSKSEKDMQISYTNMEIARLQAEHKTAKDDYEAWFKEIDKKMQTEIKAEIKNRFNYEVPIVQVENAGISSTGQAAQNDFGVVVEEYTEYRSLTNPWTNRTDLNLNF